MIETMRVAIGQFNELTSERLTFARQLGVAGVQLNTPILPGESRWELRDLQWLVARCESYGLRLEALENTPISFYDKAMLGLPGRDEQIEHYQATIRNLGAAGIPVLGYHWMPNGVWRTSNTTPGRGGALVTAFDMRLVNEHPLVYGTRELPKAEGQVATEDEMWQNYEYFLKAVLPVAEEARRRRLASTVRRRFLRWFPAAFGSPMRSLSVYLLAMTKRSRSRATSSPTKRSLVPLV